MMPVSVGDENGPESPLQPHLYDEDELQSVGVKVWNVISLQAPFRNMRCIWKQTHGLGKAEHKQN